MAKRHGQIFGFSGDVRSPADLAGIIEALERDGQISSAVACQTPEWVAARLWDRSPTDPGDRISALRSWVDRWQARRLRLDDEDRQQRKYYSSWIRGP